MTAPANEVTPAQAIAMLKVYPAQEVAWTSKDGTMRNDDGDAIDERCTVPYCVQLGPFGSWPCKYEDAVAELRKHDTLHTGRSFRLGAVVCWQPGWGFAVKEEN